MTTTNKPSTELKNLFQELVYLMTCDCGRRDWALLTYKNLHPFNNFKLIDLMSNK